MCINQMNVCRHEPTIIPQIICASKTSVCVCVDVFVYAREYYVQNLCALHDMAKTGCDGCTQMRKKNKTKEPPHAATFRNSEKDIYRRDHAGGSRTTPSTTTLSNIYARSSVH